MPGADGAKRWSGVKNGRCRGKMSLLALGKDGAVSTGEARCRPCQAMGEDDARGTSPGRFLPGTHGVVHLRSVSWSRGSPPASPGLAPRAQAGTPVRVLTRSLPPTSGGARERAGMAKGPRWRLGPPARHPAPGPGVGRAASDGQDLPRRCHAIEQRIAGIPFPWEGRCLWHSRTRSTRNPVG